MQKKAIKIIMLIVLALSLVMGCSNQASNGNGSDTKEITMWTRESSASLIEEAVQKYNSLDRGATIKVKSMPSDNFSDQFAAALASGNAPDIVSIDLVLVPYFSSIGAFTDLTSQFNSLEYKDQFNSAMVHLGQRDGKQYALPFSADVSALIYNKDHFREVGLDPEKPPTTWEELRVAANKLTNENHYGYVYTGASAGGLMFTFMPYVWGNGGQVLSDDGLKAVLNSPETEEALTFFTDLVEGDKVSPQGASSYDWTQAHDAFFSERVSMIVSGNFQINNLNNNYPDLDFGVTLVPKNGSDGQHSSFSGGELIAVTSSSDVVNEAWDFIQYALTEEVQVEAFAKNGVIPVRKDMYQNKYFEEQPKYKVFAEALSVAHAPYTTKYNELYNPILSGLQKVFNGELTPKEGIEEITKNMNQILNK